MKARAGPALAGAGVGLALAVALLLPAVLSRAVPCRLDLADFFWPMKAYTAERWTSGAPPLWNPLSGCGEPWLAQLQSGVFYPGDLPFFLPFPYGALLGIALHMAIAAAGMARWLEELGTSRAAALAGAAVYAGGGPFLSLLLVYNNACTAAYLPWLFVGVREILLGGRPLALAVPAALSFLAGEPALAGAGLAVAVTAGIATRGEGEFVRPERALRAATRLAGPLALAAGLTAVAALPFVEHLVRSDRLRGVSREEALARPVRTADLADLVVPPRAEAVGREHGDYLVTLALGPAVLLATAGCAAGFPGRRRLLAWLCAAGALGLVLSLGPRGLIAPLLYDAGLLRGLRYPARWFAFTQLFLAFAAGAGLDGWLYGRWRPQGVSFGGPGEAAEVEEPESRLWIASALSAAAGAVILVLLLILAASQPPALRGGPRFLVAAFAAGLFALAIAVARLAPGFGRIAPTVCFAALAAPLPFLSWDVMTPAPAGAVAGRPAVLGDLPDDVAGRVFVAVHDGPMLGTFLAARGTVPPPEAARRSHAALAGYANLSARVATVLSPSPLPSKYVPRLLSAALNGGDAASVLSLADVRHVVTPFPAAMPGARLARRGEVLRYDLPSPSGRVFFAREVVTATDEAALAAISRPGFVPEAVAYVASAPGALPPVTQSKTYAVASVTKDLPEEMEIAVTASRPTFAVVTKAYDRGWSAELDRAPAPLVRADVAFLGVSIPKGEHTLRLRYRPLSYRAGLWISGVSLIIAAAMFLAGGPPRAR